MQPFLANVHGNEKITKYVWRPYLIADGLFEFLGNVFVFRLLGLYARSKLLDLEVEKSESLKEEIELNKRKADEVRHKQEAKINSLSRENELLKHQLKKYVSAVMKLRDGPQAYETLAKLEGDKHENNGDNKYVDYHFEASEFEKKLIQVAEMHGELLEFNEHLQRVLQSKDAIIRRLRDELIDVRGPLPGKLWVLPGYIP